MSGRVTLTVSRFRPDSIAVGCDDADAAQELAGLAKSEGVYKGRQIQESAGEYIAPVLMAVAGSGGVASVIHTFVFRNQHRTVRVTLPNGREVEVTGASESETAQLIEEALNGDPGEK